MTGGEAEKGAPESAPPRARRFARLRSALLLLFRVLGGLDRVRVRAMALTFISVFALVPALVVAFSVVQAFTGMERIASEVHEFLLQNLAVGARASIEPYLDRFVHNAHVARAGVVGAALLLFSAYSLYSNLEGAVNELWEVRHRRSLRMEALIYWLVLTLGPVILAGSASLGGLTSSFFESRGVKVLAHAAGYLLTSFFLTVIYLVLPSARVRVRAAIVGGVTAGAAWVLAKWLFTQLVTKFVHYSAIYGSLASIPIFLTWLYLSWFILLFGARLAFVVQYGRGVVLADGSSTSAGRELLGGRALLLVVRAFQAGAPAPTPEALVRTLRAGPGALDVLEVLKGAGLLTTLVGGGLVPGRAPETITLMDVRRALAGPEAEGVSDSLSAAVSEAGERAGERLRLTTLRDLCDDEGRAPAGGKVLAHMG
ncbi:MAG TPA: YhjD/YihY/BrkB family envelope integrity protein [Anaeromyxobacter sp.]|nr:YhjD/YihY/BrkB family envelope integrity protein [Anaeromyxobacter sp.]